jgi:hypothetical protein
MRSNSFLSLITISKSVTTRCSDAYVDELSPLLRRIFTLGLPPQHDGVNQWLRRGPCNMAKSCYELVKFGIYSRATDELYAGLWLASVCDTLADLQFGLADECVEKVMERIFADILELMRVLRMP